MSKPTIPEAAEALRAYYRLPGKGMGGVVHIITEDGNCSQSNADWCVEQAIEPADRRVAELLAAMSTTQRRKLYAAYNFSAELHE